MRKSLVAELLKLRRRSVLVATGSIAVAYATLTTLVTFLPAKSGTAFRGPRGITATLESLAKPEGATAAFGNGIGFLGVLLLAVFISNIGFEYARGTFAAALMKQPRRLRLLAGKMSALFLFLAAALAVAEAAGMIAGLAIAPVRGISTATWFSASGLLEGLGAYGTALFVAFAWASFGMAVAIFTRSVPVALGIGIAWAGPIEHITQRAWSGATGWFPGLLLETFSVGGTVEVSSQRALTMVLAYASALVAAAAVIFARRDVTA
jgi:ABC-type transport system involved in multi-copper enzyme maturation permease subunit